MNFENRPRTLNSMRSALVAALAASLGLHPAAYGTPSFRYVPIPSGAASAFDVNARGHVVGDILSGDDDNRSWEGSGFLWRDGLITPLPANFGIGGLTDDGDIGGTDIDEYQALIWRDGVVTSLPVPSDYSELYGAASSGRLVGGSQGPYGWLPGYYDNGWTTLPAVGCETCGADGYVFGANSRGDMVGGGDDGQTFVGQRPIVWRNDSYSYLPLTGGLNSGFAYAINDTGTIVGYMRKLRTASDPPGYVHPAVAAAWIDDTPQLLAGPGSHAWDVSRAGATSWDVQARGLIVGQSQGRATLWIADSTGFTEHDLNSLVANSDSMPPLVAALAINDCGVIVGRSGSGSFMLVPFDQTDTDGDGLWDSWEVCGIDADEDGSIDLRLPGADPLRKDLYVELDAMSSAAVPEGALDSVVAAFAAAPIGNPGPKTGIKLHFVGKMDPENPAAACDPCIDEEDLPSSDYSDFFSQFDALWCGHLGSTLEQASGPGPGSKAARLLAKSKLFRYGVIAERFTQPVLAGVGGYAGIPGNWLTITLGDLPTPISRQEFAGTLMHELGHTLGLHDGGDQYDPSVPDRYNFKPNYPSVMNYMWQMPVRLTTGFPVIDESAMVLYQDSWKLDYSSGGMDPIEELILPDLGNLGGEAGRYALVGMTRDTADDSLWTSQIVPMSGIFDWDPSTTGTTDDVNVNYIHGWSDLAALDHYDELNDHHDWAALQYLPLQSPDWILYDGSCPSANLMNATAGLGSEVRQELTIARFLALASVVLDCNGNGIRDQEEIFAGTATDANANGIPDECEQAPTTDVPADPAPTSSRHVLGVASPNPFSPSTVLGFTLSDPAPVILEIYDLGGRRVRTLARGDLPAGRHQAVWDGRDGAHQAVAPGVYFYRLIAGAESHVRKVVRVR